MKAKITIIATLEQVEDEHTALIVATTLAKNGTEGMPNRQIKIEKCELETTKTVNATFKV